MGSKSRKNKQTQVPTAGGMNQPDPSPWVLRFAPQAAPGARVLDLACGGGRHGRLFLDRGHPVTFADKERGGVRDLADRAGATLLEANLEGPDWPLGPEKFGAIVVTNYLWRPRLQTLLAHLDGLLIYETFAEGNERFGRPKNPDFLLKRGELFELMRGRGRVLAYEQCVIERPKRALVQRIAAMIENQVLFTPPRLGPKQRGPTPGGHGSGTGSYRAPRPPCRARVRR